MKEQAVLLLRDAPLLEARRIGKVLSFLGVPSRTSNVTELIAAVTARDVIVANSRIFCSADVFLTLIKELERSVGLWKESIHSAFVYGANDPSALETLVNLLTADSGSAVPNVTCKQFTVSNQFDDFCGVMAGVQTTATRVNRGADVVLNVSNENAISIISADHGSTFLGLEYNGVPIFLSTSKEIIDIDSKLTSQNFDVRHHFLSAVPIVLYIKWAFAETCWSAPEISACLVIDDPVLKSRHGFVDFQELLCLMNQHNFSTNIAFIPWNSRRSAPEVVRLFRESPEKYSLSVHGCDHTRAEFGGSDEQRLYWKTQQALERMNRHESITGIRHDQVMVFPQGIFSEAAMSALKHTDLIAAVNNDIISAGPHPKAITISDVWGVAVMRYDFPLFTRRYPWEGIENFAFDALLGKPAIIVIHHDYCSNHCSRLINFIDRVNELKLAPAWRNLQEVLRRSYRQRELSTTEAEVEMYAAELRIENRFGQPMHFLVRRRECEPSAIREISDGSGPVSWSSANGYINFEVELKAGESKVIRIKFHALPGSGYNGDNLSYRFKAMLRRYLCEIRDNYITTTKSRLREFASR